MNNLNALALSVVCAAAVLTLNGCDQSGGSGTPANTSGTSTAPTGGTSEAEAPAGEPTGEESPAGEQGSSASSDDVGEAAAPTAARPDANALGDVSRTPTLSRQNEGATEVDRSASKDLRPSGAELSVQPTAPSGSDSSLDGGTKPLPKKPAGTSLSNQGQPTARQTPQEVTTPGATFGAVMVTAEPTKLDLGEIPTADSGTGTVRLTNTGDEARILIDCKKTCGCTTINCPKNKTLQPGEHVDIEIRLNGGTRPTKLNKNVTFLLSDGHPPVRVSVSAQAVSYVTIEPELLDKTRNPDGVIVLASIDEQPFTINSMYPPVIEAFDTEAKTSHELVFDWARWEELGAQRKLMFSLDHPKCAKLYGTIDAHSIPPRQPRPGDPTPTRTEPRAPDIGRLIKSDQVDQAIKLIDDGKIDVESVDRAGKTPLLAASELGSVEVMQALLDASADIGATDRVGRTALMWAAQSKNAAAVRLLLDADADFAAKDNIGNTAVSWACGFGDAASVKALLDAGASIEVTGAVGGFTPIIWAAGFGEAETLKLLIEAGADINSGDILQGATPLMHAVRTNRPDNVRLLLEAGADLEARDHKGQTPFLVAAANSGADTSMLQLLLEAGADINDVDGNNQTALSLARRRTDLRAEAVVAMLEELLGIEPETPPAPPAGGGDAPQQEGATGGNTETDGG